MLFSIRLDTPDRQPFIEHLKELRIRLTWCFLALLLGTALGYMMHGTILTVLVQPLGRPLYFSSPAGGFEFILQICLAFGLLAATPVLLYHMMRFVQPAIPRNSRLLVFQVLIVSLSLLGAGVSFGYFVTLPAALRFLGMFDIEAVEPLITTAEYLSFAIRYVLGFGLLFQLPLVLLLINSVAPLSTKALLAKQHWVILASFVMAAILTPTFDILNQLLFAVPIIVLYQVSILTIWIRNRGRHKGHDRREQTRTRQ